MRARVAIQSLFVPNTHVRREIATRNKAVLLMRRTDTRERITGETIDVRAQLTGAPLSARPVA